MKDEELKDITGGTFPEEIGDPVMMPGGYISYKICDKCGGAMFPVKIRQTSGNKMHRIIPEYECSECGARTHVVPIFK